MIVYIQEVIGKSYTVFEPSQIKTKSQLLSIYEQAKGEARPKPFKSVRAAGATNQPISLNSIPEIKQRIIEQTKGGTK